MVSAKGLWYGDRKSRDLLSIGEDEGPVGFQLFGSDPEIMAFAARELRDERNVIIRPECGMSCTEDSEERGRLGSVEAAGSALRCGHLPW